MPPTAEEIVEAVAGETTLCLDECLMRIRHCLGQLSDEQVWWRPYESMNSIGNLILHLNGNVRQWIVAGLGNAADDRNRPQEFLERTMIPKDRMMAQLEGTISEAKVVLSRITADDVLEQRRIQGFDVNGFGVIFDCVPHFKGHTQEIICLTRWQLGDAYGFHWEPQTPEEGATE
ncbi:MAG: DUF1572 family protein [Planctomycetes bacterium]|nr:DUF1572 family protein [Planctomycetota bacterium]MBL7040231.1 DUF1572 family protein [Pirellulaceae bacterium]